MRGRALHALAPGRPAVTGAEAIHATVLVVREAGVVIRGPSGAGKSRLALLLIGEAGRRGIFARLVGDDRVLVHPHARGVTAVPHPAVAGLIERRTQLFARLPFEPRCRVRLIVDLHPPAAPLPRYPAEDGATATLAGVAGLPLLRLQGPPDPLACDFVLEALGTHPVPHDGP